MKSAISAHHPTSLTASHTHSRRVSAAGTAGIRSEYGDAREEMYDVEVGLDQDEQSSLLQPAHGRSGADHMGHAHEHDDGDGQGSSFLGSMQPAWGRFLASAQKLGGHMHDKYRDFRQQ